MTCTDGTVKEPAHDAGGGRLGAPHSTAELLRRLDRLDDARSVYRRALELVHSHAERRFLERRLKELAR
jgi:predicted RNA polymerase sigma factor